ncbi:hypothetical protein N7492_009369 [Penicillium capsulatum]|uniref:Uncharacterized protein n=1 Tax=Penicillium capsulatum TaxID=69766 RepID=A0A9W9LGT2_9EURO|nr:hypothetical protein N7492_009369 [Penicillium capsulatum]KAJ6106762.1 hypothetical protein N7512_010279 [Penicillium capsulatum]
MSTFPHTPRRQSSGLSIEEPEECASVNPHQQCEFSELLDYLRTPIAPLVSCTTGQVGPDFPKNALAYLLLTSTQLDNLARHYHQVWPPTAETHIYPKHITPWLGNPAEASIDLETKRYRFGVFIGLGAYEAVQTDEPAPLLSETETEAQVLEFLEKEWQEALLRARQEEWGFGGK